MNRILFFQLSILIFLFHKISIAQQEPYHPLRITSTITIDGKFNEPEWQQANAEDDFMQTGPSPGADATEKTEVRILYDDQYLYVGIRCYDREPDKIFQLHLERDYSIGEDDGTSFQLDTYNDKNTGVCFVSNTLDARWDAQVTQDGGDLADSYNTYWDVASHIDSLGYITEYRIPFSSLRFETKPEITMGFRVARMIYRKSELVTYPRLNPKMSDGWANVSASREIVFVNLKSRKPFYISPYVIANYSMQNQLNSDGTGYEKSSEFMTRKFYSQNETLDKILSNIGVDAKYGLSKNFTLDLTLNTDFAQAEVDDQIINLSKYEVNLPEKRSFFLESASNFSFGFPTGNNAFISRTIGNENGVIVPIIAGARVTGKSNGWQIGTLDMQTKGIAEENISPHNFFVFRTRKDIDSLGSVVGGIFTNRINTDTTNISNQTIGLSSVKRLNQQVSILAGVAGTLENFNFGDIGKSMYYSAGIFRSASEGFIYNASVDVVTKDFNPVMGYLDAPDHLLVNGDFKYQLKAKDESKVAYWYLKSNDLYRATLSTGRRETFYTDLTPGVSFKNWTDISFSLFEYKIDTLFYDWFLDDKNAIAAGTYKMFNNTLNFTTPGGKNYGGSLTATYGDFYGGKRIFISPDVHYNINKHFSIGLTYEYNHIAFDMYLDQDSSTLYKTNLIRFRLSYLISTKLSFKLYTQYDDLNHSISSNLRFRYNPHEGTDLYIVLNQLQNTDLERLDPHLPRMDSQAITVKFVKTFGL